jgi:hypothetical protein
MSVAAGQLRLDLKRPRSAAGPERRRRPNRIDPTRGPARLPERPAPVVDAEGVCTAAEPEPLALPIDPHCLAGLTPIERGRRYNHTVEGALHSLQRGCVEGAIRLVKAGKYPESGK